MNKEYIQKLRSDFLFFTEHILYLRGRSGKRINFRLNKAQKILWHEIKKQQQEESQVRLVVLKGRQMGISTFIAALNFYQGWSRMGQHSFIMAHRKDAAQNLMHILQNFINGLPPEITPKQINKSASAFKLRQQDSFWQILTAGASDVGRSESIQFLHASEVAFWDNAATHLTALFACVPEDCNSHIIIESTANGKAGAFYDLCKAAQRENSPFKLIFLPWFLEPTYKAKPKEKISDFWKKYQTKYKLSDSQVAWAINKNASFAATESKEGDKELSLKFQREYPAEIEDAFKATISDGLIHVDTVNKALRHKAQFDKYSPLILGVDLARGGKDKSWMISRRGRQLGLEVNEGNEVDDAMQQADWIATYIEKYNPARVFIDAGAHGAAVYDRLKQLGFGCKVEAVYFGSKASDNKRWFNKRAEMWDKLRLWLTDNLGAQMVDDDELIRQICAPRFTYSHHEQLKLEAKENIRLRLGCSPDRADAAVLTFAAPVASLGRDEVLYQQKESEYDPLKW